MGKMTSETEGKIGDTRKFHSFPNKEFLINEIIIDANINLNWTWNTGVCPYCKNRISREITHDIYRIEILIDDSKDKDKIKVTDIVLLADTLDKRKMILPRDKYNEVFSLSEKYKHLIGGD